MFAFYIFYLQFIAKGKQAEMPYYLGHTDSCQGDSGGPLWQYIGKLSPF